MLNNYIMKRILLLAIVVASGAKIHAQNEENASKNDEAALVAINRQFIKNFINNDTVEHTRIIHPNFLFIGKDGSLHDRNEYMAGWAHGYDQKIIPEFVLEEVQVRIFDDVALIVAKTRDKTMKDGQWTIGETRYTDTYIKENGEWKCVQVQLTRMPVQIN
jgi:ketosteroid isomerase-like protein